MATHFWHFRSTNDPESEILPYCRDIPELFTINLHSCGEFTNFNKREYDGGQLVYIDGVDILEMSTHFLDNIMNELGHDKETRFYYYWRKPNLNLSDGLSKLETDDNVKELLTYIGPHKEIDIYVLKEDMHDVQSPEMRKRSSSNIVSGSCSRRLNFI